MSPHHLFLQQLWATGYDTQLKGGKIEEQVKLIAYLCKFTQLLCSKTRTNMQSCTILKSEGFPGYHAAHFPRERTVSLLCPFTASEISPLPYWSTRAQHPLSLYW